MKKLILPIILLSTFVLGIYSYNNLPTKKTEIIASTLMPAMDKSELIVDSDVVLEGEVIKLSKSRWSNPNFERGRNIRNILQTDVIIKVNKVLKGNPYSDKEVVVRINKGEDKNTILKSEAEADFKKGEKVILFLKKDNSDCAKPDENYYVLKGMRQGKFILDTSIKDKKVYKMDDKSEDISVEVDNFDAILKQETENMKNSGKKKLTDKEVEEINRKFFGDELIDSVKNMEKK